MTATDLHDGPPHDPDPSSGRVRLVLDALHNEGVGDQVAAWREAAIGAGQTVSAEDQRRFATSVISDRLQRMAERDIDNGVPPLSPDDDGIVLQALLDDMFGAGVLDRLLADPGVENIDAIGCDRVWISYADGRKEPGPPLWRTDDEMIEHLRRLGARSGMSERRFDNAAPELNLQLPNGARLFAVMAVTARPCLSVRRHRLVDVSLKDLRATGMFDLQLEHFLRCAVQAMNLLVAGTNAGKTVATLLTRSTRPNGWSRSKTTGSSTSTSSLPATPTSWPWKRERSTPKAPATSPWPSSFAWGFG
jgi:hypothetical protein